MRKAYREEMRMMLRGNRVATTAVMIGAICSLAVVTDIAKAAEDRCDELGSNCICSEPMNANDGAIPKGHDFSDSSAKECTAFGLYYDSNKDSSNVSMVSERDMPTGNAVSHVLAIGPGGGGIVWLNGRATPAATDQRVCVRYYFQVDPNFSGAGPNNVGCPSERNKMLQFSFGNASPYQLVEPAGSTCAGPPGSGLSPYRAFSSVQHGMASGGDRSLLPSADWSACFVGESWCRAEACVHGNLSSGTGIYVDARVNKVNGGSVHELLNHGPVNPGQRLSLASADLYHGQGSGPVGTRYISHFMQAAWSTNNGQWIGPAAEIETGGGPTGSNRPLPPKLLDDRTKN